MKKKIVTVQKLNIRQFKNQNQAENYINDFYNNQDDLHNGYLNRIPEDKAFYSEDSSPEKEALRYVIQSGALNVLSEQEYRVFHLIFREGFSLKKAGNHLEVKKSTVTEYVKRIGDKLQNIVRDELIYQYS